MDHSTLATAPLAPVSNAALTITGGGTVMQTSASNQTFIATSYANATVTVGGGIGASLFTTAGIIIIGETGTGAAGTLTVVGGGTVSCSRAIHRQCHRRRRRSG